MSLPTEVVLGWYTCAALTRRSFVFAGCGFAVGADPGNGETPAVIDPGPEANSHGKHGSQNSVWLVPGVAPARGHDSRERAVWRKRYVAQGAIGVALSVCLLLPTTLE